MAMEDPAGLLVFENVRAIDPAQNLDDTVDVVVERGRITRVGSGAAGNVSSIGQARVLDGRGKWLLPAFVDPHVHFREPGHEYKEDVASGLRAAAAGGYAHVCAMPNTKPVNDTKAVSDLMVARAREAGGPTLHPIGAITVGLKGQELTEMAELRDAGCVAVSDDGRCVMDSAVLRCALEYASSFGLPLIQHAEDHALTHGAQMHEGQVSTRMGLRGWPRIAEDAILARDLMLAEHARAPYHAAHISTEGAVRLLREAKERGVRATCEVTPHHLLLDDSSLLGYDTACKVNPPLREPRDVEALRAALADGTIDAVATDHAPQSPLEKDCEFQQASPGLIGLELSFGLLLGLVREGKLPIDRLVLAMSTGPAGVVGLQPPAIRADSVAELVLVDPERTWTVDAARLRSKSANTPFLGREITGRVELTVARGAVVFDAEAERA